MSEFEKADDSEYCSGMTVFCRFQEFLLYHAVHGEHSLDKWTRKRYLCGLISEKESQSLPILEYFIRFVHFYLRRLFACPSK